MTAPAEFGAPRHAPPFRWVDRVLERGPGARCVTEKLFAADEPILRGVSVVPSSIVFEALCQAAVFLPGEGEGREGRILRIDQAEIAGEVRVGDRLVITTVLIEEGTAGIRAESAGEVEGKPIAKLKVLIARDRGGS